MLSLWGGLLQFQRGGISFAFLLMCVGAHARTARLGRSGDHVGVSLFLLPSGFWACTQAIRPGDPAASAINTTRVRNELNDHVRRPNSPREVAPWPLGRVWFSIFLCDA